MATAPGTETKVTPLSEAPIIPKATKYHGDFLFPVKKDESSLFFSTSFEIPSKSKKYNPIISKSMYGLMFFYDKR